MHDDIDPGLARLIVAHPAIFRGQAPEVASYLSAGWYSLVDKLCDAIEGALGVDGLKQFECRQIKEKFGTLRFYWRYGYLGSPSVDLISAGGIASFEASSAESDRRLEMVAEFVDVACCTSASICETCGRSGRLVVQDGWRMTRCIEHTPRPDDANE